MCRATRRATRETATSTASPRARHCSWLAAAKIDTTAKVAPIEQAFAAAGATQLVLNAAHALGFSAFLFSGAGVFDVPFKASLGLDATDHLIGFICLGTANGPGKPGPSAEAAVRKGLEETVKQWAP